MPENDKKAVRKAVRSAFPGLAARDEQSATICRHVLAWDAYRSARVIGGYMPMAHEADVTTILLDAMANGKTLALPRCGKPPEMTFHRVRSLDELVQGAYGLLEPAADAPVVPAETLDLLLTPLEAVAHHGARLGKGGGYYDCLLSRSHAFALGIALDHQWVEALAADEWDQSLDACAGTQGIVMF